MHPECPKYPKNLKNNQNLQKNNNTTPPPQKKTFKMTKIPLKPQNQAKYP